VAKDIFLISETTKGLTIRKPAVNADVTGCPESLRVMEICRTGFSATENDREPTFSTPNVLTERIIASEKLTHRPMEDG